jgi:DnaJ-class molecular chaperone
MTTCPNCYGKGVIDCPACYAKGLDLYGEKCKACDGSGKRKCPACDGTGYSKDN